MSEEIKTEDIIKSLRECVELDCNGCIARYDGCVSKLKKLAADRLEQLNSQRTDHFADANKMVPDDDRIMRQAIETYGTQAQCDVAIEEMAELTKAIMKIRRVANDYEKTPAALDNLLEEIADVDIMVDQLKIMWGPKQVEEYRRKKLERLERRLNDDRS